MADGICQISKRLAQTSITQYDNQSDNPSDKELTYHVRSHKIRIVSYANDAVLVADNEED